MIYKLTSMKSIDFYYDYGSPTAYLAWTQIRNLDLNLYKVTYFPILLGGVFKATDNKAPGLVVPKAKWMSDDIKMYANKYKVKFVMNDAFPINTLYLMRGAIYAKQNNFLEKYNEAIFLAMWSNNINLSDPKNIIITLDKNGFNSNDFMNAAESQQIKDELKKVTVDAVNLGMFGVPSFIVDGKLFFGQDRMSWFID